MKVNILEKTKNEMRIEIVGEGHTFCNALQNALLKDSTVEFAGYSISHPLVAQPILYVRTKGRRSPEKAVVDAAKALGKETEEIRIAFQKVLKKEERAPSK